MLESPMFQVMRKEYGSLIFTMYDSRTAVDRLGELFTKICSVVVYRMFSNSCTDVYFYRRDASLDWLVYE